MMNLLLSQLPDRPLLVLCLGAHCDDIEIGCGATLLELRSHREVIITWAVFTSNTRRAAELEQSAHAFLGADAPGRLTVERHRDGFLPYVGAAVKDDFETLKGRVQPDLIFTHYRHDLHQDHRLVSELTWNTFRSHLILEYEIPKVDGDIGNPNLYQPVSAEVCERKIAQLLSCYPSQSTKPWFTADLFRAMMRLRGMECGSPSGFAEAFYARKLTLGS